jgi:hypothetical protein
MGLAPSMGCGPAQGDLDCKTPIRRKGLPKRHRSIQRDAAGFGAGLFPFQSPLLGKSLLVSFPPPNNMLKFSGYSRLKRGKESEDNAFIKQPYHKHVPSLSTHLQGLHRHAHRKRNALEN